MEVVVSMIAVLMAVFCLLFIGFNEFREYRQRLAEVRQGGDETKRSRPRRSR